MAVPEDLDNLLEALAATPARAAAPSRASTLRDREAGREPRHGVFQAGEGIGVGAPVGVGHLIGRVGDHDVRSPFAGELMESWRWRASA